MRRPTGVLNLKNDLNDIRDEFRELGLGSEMNQIQLGNLIQQQMDNSKISDSKQDIVFDDETDRQHYN